MKKCFIKKNFRKQSVAIIQLANKIIEEYAEQGFTLTLRQLYYQFVARDFIPNEQSWYKKLGNIINDARLAGLIDWDALEDRTRNIKHNPHWDNISQILEGARSQYREDIWDDQDYHVEVWIEKDALIGVIEGVCRKNDVTYFSCRGYVSSSEMYSAGMRMQRAIDAGKKPVILHLGDHDPSGIDMTYDIWKRLNMFVGADVNLYDAITPKQSMKTLNWDFLAVDVRRLGINKDQIKKYAPPPNPAKLTDSRAEAYIKAHGMSSWELDSLSPAVLAKLIDTEIATVVDYDRMDVAKAKQQLGRDDIGKMIDKYETDHE